MKVYQKYNKRNKSWIKIKKEKDGVKIINVKQKEPRKPFKGVKKI